MSSAVDLIRQYAKTKISFAVVILIVWLVVMAFPKAHAKLAIGRHVVGIMPALSTDRQHDDYLAIYGNLL